MMRGLLTLVAGTITIVVTLMVGALLVARAQPYSNPLQSQGFDYCDGLPCYRGIVPGKTTYPELQTILGMPQFNIGTRVFTWAEGTVQKTAPFDENIDHIPWFNVRYTIGSRPYTFSDFIDLYGTPCTEAYVTPPYILLIYPQFTILVESIRHRLSQFSPIIQIQIRQSKCNSGLLWRGFAHTALYRPW